MAESLSLALAGGTGSPAGGLAGGDETVGWVIGRDAALHAISQDDPNVKPAHTPGELRGDGVTVIELHAVTPSAEDLLHLAADLDEIFL